MKLFSVVTFAVAMSIVACSGGGQRTTLGRQCPAGGWKPFTMDLNNSQERVELDPNLNQILPGKYTYEGSTLYYVDKSDLRVQVDDARQKDNNFKSNTSCIRNPKAALNPVSVDAVRNIVLDKNKKYAVEVNTISINIENTVFKASTKTDPNKKLESPKEPYLQAAESFMVAIKNDTTHYEIRSRGTTPSGGEYILQVRLTRTDNP